KGLPARLYETGWSSDSEEPSFDYYLAALIYRDSDIFGAGNNGTIGINYQIHYLNSGHFRSLSAATDRTVAYGRVEAINNERTKSLIDRTLLAEQHGFRGNLLTEEIEIHDSFSAMLRSEASNCRDYAVT